MQRIPLQADSQNAGTRLIEPKRGENIEYQESDYTGYI